MHQGTLSVKSLYPMNAACPEETEVLWVMNVVQIPVRVHIEISGSVCYNLLCAKPQPMKQTLLNLILTESFSLEKTS